MKDFVSEKTMSEKKKVRKQGQAALEYMTTYGWAIMAALIAIGAMAYFGFLSPTRLLPSQCNFGKQLQCVEYRIVSDESTTARADIIFLNNFGKPINITGVGGDATGDTNPGLPFVLNSGEKASIEFTLNNPEKFSQGYKKQANLVIYFQRADVSNPPPHELAGYVFSTVQPLP